MRDLPDGRRLLAADPLPIDVAVPDQDPAAFAVWDDILTPAGCRVAASAFGLTAIGGPGAPAPAGDVVPAHLFEVLPAEPLGPVLRPDAGLVPPTIRIKITAAELDAALERHAAASALGARAERTISIRARIRAVWAEYHEWIAAAAIIALVLLSLAGMRAASPTHVAHLLPPPYLPAL